MKADEIQMVGLDAWGTLVDYGPETLDARSNAMNPYTNFLVDYGIEFDSNDEFSKFYRQAKNNIEDLSEITGRHIGAEERLLIITLGLGVPVGEIDHEDLSRVSRDVQENCENVSPRLIEPSIADDLDRLKSNGNRLAIVSNLGMVSASYMRRSFDSLGILEYFDYEIFSDEVGVCKPNPRIFSNLCEVANVNPETVLFIGDNIRADYDGPREFGMQAVHLTEVPSDTGMTALSVSRALDLAGLIS